jgi:hypothetical protein
LWFLAFDFATLDFKSGFRGEVGFGFSFTSVSNLEASDKLAAVKLPLNMDFTGAEIASNVSFF